MSIERRITEGKVTRMNENLKQLMKDAGLDVTSTKSQAELMEFARMLVERCSQLASQREMDRKTDMKKYFGV